MTTVKLLSHTALPKETVYCAWVRSRDVRSMITPTEVRRAIIAGNEDLAFKVSDIFSKLIDTHLPLAEIVQFTFWLDDVPISLREQLVRHRIGTKVNGVPDVDVFPNQSDSTWWAQGMRVMNMAEFASEGKFHVPESIRNHKNPDCLDEYVSTMMSLQQAYTELVEVFDIPREDARQVIPLGATHGLSWTLNLQALKHIIGHRTCWILQIGMWEDVIRGMIRELVDNIDPLFQKLINPPCIKGDEFTGCVFKIDNQRRITGEDEPPPCSLYLNRERADALAAAEGLRKAKWEFHGTRWFSDAKTMERYESQKEKYKGLWQRHPDTGAPLPLAAPVADPPS